MAVSVLFGIIFTGRTIPELSLQNLHPQGLPVWPYMFITVACGAISGFHATQSPMIAKCITSEKQGRAIFAGAMLAESVIALIWAAAGMAFYGSTASLNEALSTLGQSGTVYEISNSMLGIVGGAHAVIGVVVCPITSGDTAFRSARLILAETFRLKQDRIRNRLIITIPLLVTGGLLTWYAVSNDKGFQTVWRYFSWSNQTLAMISLWVATAYLLKSNSNRWTSMLTALPATFMSAVSSTYICMAKEGLQLSQGIAYPIGIVFALALFGFYLSVVLKQKDNG
jgi:carbon starvation protein CstA